MAHSLESFIREVYAAFGRGDVDGYLSACTQDFTFNVPGRGALAGTLRGAQGCMTWPARRWRRRAARSGRARTSSRTISTPSCCLATRVMRGGHQREYRTEQVYDVRDGKLAECSEQPRNPDAYGDALVAGL